MTAPEPGRTLTEADVEALAARVAALAAIPRGLVTVRELAGILGVDVGYVYDHKAELGALRLPGGGDRPPIRFDVDRTLRMVAASSAGAPVGRPTARARHLRAVDPSVPALEVPEDLELLQGRGAA